MKLSVKGYFLSDQKSDNIINSSIKSPSLSSRISSAFTPYRLFQWSPQSMEILLNLSMKYWNSASNAQGSILIIEIAQVGAVKIYVAAVEALTKKERGDETQFTTKIGGKISLGPNYFVLYCKISFPDRHLMPYYVETGRSHPLIAWFTDNFHRVFLQITLSLGLLSPPVPSFSEVLKVRNFY